MVNSKYLVIMLVKVQYSENIHLRSTKHNSKYGLSSPKEKLKISQLTYFCEKHLKKKDKKFIRLTRTVSGGWPQFIRLTNRNCADSILTLPGAPSLFHAA